MQRAILIKQANDWQIGHLYEHLYCDALDDFLLEHGFLASLDYHISGKTFSNGVIEISVIGFTKQVSEYMHELSNLKIDFSKTPLAMKQIMAEKSAIILTDISLIKEKLNQLEDLRWQSISDVKTLLGFLDSNFLQLQPNDKITKDLTVSLTIKNTHLNPLFPFLANVIKVNLVNFIIKTYGGFYNDDDWNYDNEKNVEFCQILTTEDVDIDVFGVQQYFQEIVQKMRKKMSQIVEFFATADYSVPLAAPNEIEVADRTGVFVGEAGWKDLAVAENIEEILDSVIFEII